LIGMLVFFLIEKSARIMRVGGGGGGHGHSHGGVDHHAHSHGDSRPSNKTTTTATTATTAKSVALTSPPAVTNLAALSNGATAAKSSTASTVSSELRHRSVPASSASSTASSSTAAATAAAVAAATAQNNDNVAAWLNLLADGAHNFTDGMAIAASFLASFPMGVRTTIAIFCHEIPHEIGDYAILIQSGWSHADALRSQFVTGLFALAGTLAVLASSSLMHVTVYLLPFTAGGFIYIATVSILPTLMTQTNGQQTIREVMAMFLGVGLMMVIGENE